MWGLKRHKLTVLNRETNAKQAIAVISEPIDKIGMRFGHGETAAHRPKRACGGLGVRQRRGDATYHNHVAYTKTSQRNYVGLAQNTTMEQF